jgi:hypothetical protein
MSRYPQPSDGRGSLRDIQILVNNHPLLFTRAIKKKLEINPSEIEWVSPLEEDEYAEYRDNGFLKRLGINTLKLPLSEFWPTRGPQWDALGRGNDREVFLVEAKANIPETISPGSAAKGKSLQLIQKSLISTKSYLQISNKVDWSGPFYQYNNRLAHLYFLRVLNQIPAYLIFVYFIGDNSVDGPETNAEWTAALTVMKRCLGIGKHRLSKYIADVFIEV